LRRRTGRGPGGNGHLSQLPLRGTTRLSRGP